MLPKKNRISRKEVGEIFKVGRVIYSSNFFLKYLINKGSKLPKVAFSAPKSVSNKAHKRNMLRRAGYDALKDKISLLPQGFSGVFVFNKKSILKEPNTQKADIYPQLDKEIKDTLAKI
ncbi:MAG: ribonuclease P protein component [Candidatus Pacebacteria bacterium]|nr:ribonuclease P protein component [Candidatus Paceibacterota bacterium]MBP9839376.1 ribonuclease P protein component [Candidatus Paceibacterota bacterium]